MQTQLHSSELNESPVSAFLSFATPDRRLVEEFRGQLISRFANLELLDHAVTDQYDKNWKLECAQKIDRSILLICLIGTTTHKSKAVAWEIDRGLSHGKRVMAFKLTERQVCLPEVLTRNSIEPLPYNAIHASATCADAKFESALHGGI